VSDRNFDFSLKSFFTVFTVFLVFCEFSAQARVFNLQSEYLASYLRGTAGTSRAGDEAFRLAGGPGTSYDDKVSYNFSGEIGFLLRFKGLVTFRVGAELLQTKPLVSIPGKNASGVDLFSLHSDVLVLQPTATLEVDVFSLNESRAFFFAGAGLSAVTIENEFVMTATGTSELGGITDFTERAVANQISGHAGFGYERLLTDTVTVAAELGYRYLPIPKFKMSNNATTIAQGATSKNDTLLNSDGSNRQIDMTGLFASVGFRFYIDFVK
jgi:hypothetical protein